MVRPAGRVLLETAAWRGVPAHFKEPLSTLRQRARPAYPGRPPPRHLGGETCGRSAARSTRICAIRDPPSPSG